MAFILGQTLNKKKKQETRNLHEFQYTYTGHTTYTSSNSYENTVTGGDKVEVRVMVRVRVRVQVRDLDEFQ